jgi:hypothetical protein
MTLNTANDAQKLMAAVVGKFSSAAEQVRMGQASQEMMVSIEQDISRLENYGKMLNAHATHVYEDIGEVQDAPDIGLELAQARQRFETSAHLAKQSRGAYLRERKIMWLWVLFAVVLGGCFVYMYIWIVGIGAADHSILSVPDKSEVLDSEIMKPSALFEDDGSGDDDDNGDDNDAFGQGESKQEDNSIEQRVQTGLEKAGRKFSRMFSKPTETSRSSERENSSFLENAQNPPTRTDESELFAD